MKPIRESVLFRTSSASDVQNSGGKITITGLRSIYKKDIVSIKQIKYRTETVQVATIGASAYTPTASTKYLIEVYDPNRRESGYQESAKIYSYVTPPVITTLGGTAALQREAIHLAIIADVNSQTAANHSVAATLTGGAGFTITDTGTYYPVRSQSMTNILGANLVLPRTNADGTGFAVTDVVVTTAAVSSFGVGSKLVKQAPVLDLMFGNLISGVLEAPPLTPDGLTAVDGQNYDGFSIESLQKIDTPSITGHYTYIDRNSLIYADNGTGVSAANLAGFKAFERAVLQNLFQGYALDTPTIYYMGNTNVVSQGLNTGLPSGVANAENVLSLGNGFSAHYGPIGTATLPALVSTNLGIGLVLDATASEGVELSAPTWTNSQKEFVVGKTAFSMYAKVNIDDVSGLNPAWWGFRLKETYNSTYTAYNTYALVGLGNGTGDIFTSIELANGGNTNVDTTLNWADTETHTLEVRVDINGVVTFFVDGYKPTVTQAFTLTAGLTMIPVFGFAIQTSDIGTPSVLELAAIADDQWRS